MVAKKLEVTDRRRFLQSLGWLASGALLAKGRTARALAAPGGEAEGAGRREIRQAAPSQRPAIVRASGPDGSVVIEGRDRPAACAVNRTGALIWSWIDGKRTVEQIAELLQRRAGFSGLQAYAYCHCFLMMLQRKGLLEL